MRNQFILSLILLLTTLLSPQFTLAEDGSSLAAAQTGITANPPRGTLYQVRYHGRTSYIFGTIHVGKSEFFPLDVATRPRRRPVPAGKQALTVQCEAASHTYGRAPVCYCRRSLVGGAEKTGAP